MATQNIVGGETSFRIGHNRSCQLLTPDRSKLDFEGCTFRLGNVVRSDSRVYPEEPRVFMAAFLRLYGQRYLAALNATPEQANLKSVQDMIWKKFLVNEVKYPDGRVIVTPKDARLPKLAGPVSVKDSEAGISPASLDTGFSFTVSTSRVTNIADMKGGSTTSAAATMAAPAVQISEDDEELKKMREELAAMRLSETAAPEVPAPVTETVAETAAPTPEPEPAPTPEPVKSGKKNKS